jgi:hypothetical protein
MHVQPALGHIRALPGRVHANASKQGTYFRETSTAEDPDAIERFVDDMGVYEAGKGKTNGGGGSICPEPLDHVEIKKCRSLLEIRTSAVRQLQEENEALIRDRDTAVLDRLRAENEELRRLVENRVVKLPDSTTRSPDVIRAKFSQEVRRRVSD